MADDELAIPQVPEPKPDDVEDVSWALSTAEAMWARGDHLEGIKWVRKAAEAASDAEDDMRSLALAKAAADLAAIIARRSTPDPAPSSSRSLPGGPPPSIQPTTTRSAAPPPPKPAAHAAKSVRSAPPLPSKSAPPPAAVPPAPSSSQRAAPRPLATGPRSQGPAQGPAHGKGILSNRPPAGDKKGRRKSKDNLEAEARAAGVLDTAPLAPLDAEAAGKALGVTDEMPALNLAQEAPRGKRRSSRPDPDPTVVGSLKDLAREKSLEEWDDSPTQNLAGEELPARGKTSVTAIASRPPKPRSPSVIPHDPGIQTTQAVRVVVWRDASGVHVAPAGTVVSALKIEAVLVALEPNADLTAWLTQKDR